MIKLRLFNKKNATHQKGQAFVETAFIFPLLLFIVLGVVEVGWALRGYLTLSNINREVTRRAVKPFYLDFSERSMPYNRDESVQLVGYTSNVIYPYFYASRGSNQYDFDADKFAMLPGLPHALNKTADSFTKGEEANLTLTYFVARTGYPCDPSDINSSGEWNCNCDDFDTALDTIFADSQNPDYTLAKDAYQNISQNFSFDDIILHPKNEGYEYYVYQYVPPNIEGKPSEPQPAFDDIQTLLREQYDDTADNPAYQNFVYYKALENAKFNCELLKKTVKKVGENAGGDPVYELGTPSEHNIVYSEIFYKQAQLLGFPILSNTLLDPISMYVQSSMRLMPTVRGGLDPSTNGPVCAPMPFVANAEKLDEAKSYLSGSGDQDGDGVYDGAFNITPINLVENGLDWIQWNGDHKSFNDFYYLKYEIEYPQMALNQRDEPLKAGDAISIWNPAIDDDNIEDEDWVEIERLLNNLAGQEVMVVASGGAGVAKIVIKSVDFDLTSISGSRQPEIYAYLTGGAEAECFDTTYAP